VTSGSFFAPFLRMLDVAALVVALTASAHAQNLTGTINGVVKDASGAVISGASVTLSNAGTGVVVRVVKTDKGGRYDAPSLLIGTYRVTVQAPGFKTTVENVVLDLDKSIPADAVLQVGSVNTEVVVATGVNTGLDLEDAAQSTLIEQKEVTELPLNQRNFVQFIALQPGVNGGTGTITRGPLAVAGGNNTMSISVNRQGTLFQRLLRSHGITAPGNLLVSGLRCI